MRKGETHCPSPQIPWGHKDPQNQRLRSNQHRTNPVCSPPSLRPSAFLSPSASFVPWFQMPKLHTQAALPTPAISPWRRFLVLYRCPLEAAVPTWLTPRRGDSRKGDSPHCRTTAPSAPQQLKLGALGLTDPTWAVTSAGRGASVLCPIDMSGTQLLLPGCHQCSQL